MESPFLSELSSVCVARLANSLSFNRGLFSWISLKKTKKNFQKSILIFSHVLETSLFFVVPRPRAQKSC